jgi:hypothetical protein
MNKVRPYNSHVRSQYLATMLGAIVTVSACAPGERGEAATVAAAGIVDSILPPDETLRRFRAGLPVVTELDGGAPSRDSLVRAFVAAVSARDTAALRDLVVSRAEYAFLFYPSSSAARPPMRQPPDVAWLLLAQGSNKGITRVLDRLGSDQPMLRSYECVEPARIEGENRFWDDCRVTISTPGGTGTLRLFGAITERHERFKFLGYYNDL